MFSKVRCLCIIHLVTEWLRIVNSKMEESGMALDYLKVSFGIRLEQLR
jgi:hypothetical protein